MKPSILGRGSRKQIQNTNNAITTENNIGINDEDESTTEGKASKINPLGLSPKPGNFSSILSKAQFPKHNFTTTILPSRPRSQPPIPLISFPSSTGGNNDPDNDVATPSLTNCKFSRRISTAKEVLWEPLQGHGDDGYSRASSSRNTRQPGNGERDGWISSEGNYYGAKKTPFYTVPKPSHSAKKLAKSYFPIPPPSSANASYKSSLNGTMGTGSYAKYTRNSSYLSDTSLLQDKRVHAGEGNSAVANPSSNNIDNKIANKPKRNKTASEKSAGTGLRRGLNTLTSNTLTPKVAKPDTKSGLLFFSNAKVLNANSATRDLEFDEDGERAEHVHQSSVRGRSGVRLMSGTGHWKVLSGTGHPNNKSGSLSTKLNERVQVIRSFEEREQSPESIRMDGMGLKTFPYIGGGEGPNLKLLSLQRNLISRLENISLHILVVLDLYDNRIERITGLQGFPSLRVLLLGKNRIRRIEGLEGLKRVEILDLHGNQIRYVDNLGVLTSLRVLNLAGNLLRSIRNLGPHGLPSLQELNIKRNRIRNVEGLVKAPDLKKLLLANNDLQSFASLLPLRKLLSLQELLLEPNPLSSATDGRNQVLTMLPMLSTLDRTGITEGMRHEARQWHKKKLAEEEDRRKEETKLRTMSPTGNSSNNSREQAIYQARRRWESVKNFVKNSNSKPTNPSSPSLLDRAGTPSKKTKKTKKGEAARSEIDDDLVGHHLRSKLRSQTLSRNSPKESKSKEVVLLEYPDGEVKLNLAQLELDLDLDQQREPILVTRVSDGGGSGDVRNSDVKPVPQPEDSCPPSMINDDPGPPHPQDYVNTNSSIGLLPLKQVQEGKRKVGLALESQVGDHEIAIATQEQEQGSQVQLLSSAVHNPQMDSSIMANIIKDPQSAQSPHPCQLGLTQTSTSQTGADAGVGDEKIHDSFLPTTTTFNALLPKDQNTENEHNFVGEKAIAIAVVRPTLREPNLDQTINISSKVFTPQVSNAEQSETTLKNGAIDDDIKRDDKLGESNNEIVQVTDIQQSLISSSSQNNSAICSAVPLDPEIDKMIQSHKSGIMSSKTSNGDVGVAEKINMLQPSVSSLMPEQKEHCPTFSEQSINNKEDETLIVNNNVTFSSVGESETSVIVTSAAPSTSANILYSTLAPTTSNSQIDPTFSPTTVGSTLQNSTSWRNSCNANKPNLRKLRSASFDGRLPSSGLGSDDEHFDVDDDDTCSIITSATGSTSTIATSDMSPRNRLGFSRKQLFPRTKSQRLKLRDRPSRIQSSSGISSSRAKSGSMLGLSCSNQNLSGVNRSGGVGDMRSNRPLRRCDSAAAIGLTGTCPLENNGSNLSPFPIKRQGTDFLLEIDGKVLSIYGLGALKHTLTGFPSNVTSTVSTAKFHYISYDSIIPYFGKLRQIYPSLEHFQFRANNIGKLAQLNGLADLQGLTTLHIAKEGNPLVSQDFSWIYYASYRLSHWGLQNVNGKEVSSEYRGGGPMAFTTKCFESLGFLALSCLPQTALTPLAKRLHMLHCFCCCSPSSSSDESGSKTKNGKASGNAATSSPLPPTTEQAICSSWDDDPVLLDVIGKEALVYCISSLPLSPNSSSLTPADDFGSSEILDRRRQTTLNNIIDAGVNVLEKLDKLEDAWPSLMNEIIQDILMDYKFIDIFMKKEMKKCQDEATIAIHNSKKAH